MAPASSVTAESYARRYLTSTDLAHKCDPGAVPDHFESDAASQDLRPERPVELRVTQKKPRSLKLGAVARPEVRAALHHKFWHHELQAAELFCWALLRFPDTPLLFRRGLLRIFQDEVRHMGLYQAHIESLGFSVGDFEVRDWFWERVPTCRTPLQFVALLGMGLEAANLDHTTRFEGWFRAVGDERAAEIQKRVGLEEIGHVRFATRWFRTWTGGVEFSTWSATLPAPLSPLLMRGKTIQRERRLKAEFPDEFIDALAAFQAR